MIKEDMEKVIGHTIRFDTYWMIILMEEKNMSYDKAKEEIIKNPKKYNDCIGDAFVREVTIIKYINLLYSKHLNLEEAKRRDAIRLIKFQKLKAEKQKEYEEAKKQKQEYWEKKKKEEIKKKLYGIYGVFIENKLVYIGKTTNFEQRFKSYDYELQAYNKDSRKIIKMIYTAQKERKIVSFRQLITNEDFPQNIITKEQLSAMEFSLIKMYKPSGNVEGITLPYRW